MALVASSTAARATRMRDEAGRCRFYRSSFIGSDAGAHGVVAAAPHVPTESASPYPVAYQIELDPYSDLDVHFHHANQFQVFLQGDGQLGRHPVQAVTVHYAGAHTAYGPIRPGAHGLTFITLRDAWDPGARFLPAHKDELRLARVPRREVLAASLAATDDASLAALADGVCEVLLQSDTDALGAWSLRLPPGAAVTAAPLAHSGGQFWLVLAGSLQWTDAQALLPRSCIHLDADEAMPTAHAGPAGLHLLVLRLPQRLRPNAYTRASDAARAATPRD